EAVIDALVVKLKAGLPDAIAQLNAADTKGIVLPDITDVLDYIPTPGQNNRLPVVGISEGPSEIADDTGHGATGDHQLVLVTFVQDADQQRLAVMLRRYTRAVLSVAIEGRSVGP